MLLALWRQYQRALTNWDGPLEQTSGLECRNLWHGSVVEKSTHENTSKLRLKAIGFNYVFEMQTFLNSFLYYVYICNTNLNLYTICIYGIEWGLVWRSNFEAMNWDSSELNSPSAVNSPGSLT